MLLGLNKLHTEQDGTDLMNPQLRFGGLQGFLTYLECCVARMCKNPKKVGFVIFVLGKRMKNPPTENATLPGYCVRGGTSCVHRVLIPGMFIWKQLTHFRNCFGLDSQSGVKSKR